MAARSRKKTAESEFSPRELLAPTRRKLSILVGIFVVCAALVVLTKLCNYFDAFLGTSCMSFGVYLIEGVSLIFGRPVAITVPIMVIFGILFYMEIAIILHFLGVKNVLSLEKSSFTKRFFIWSGVLIILSMFILAGSPTLQKPILDAKIQNDMKYCQMDPNYPDCICQEGYTKTHLTMWNGYGGPECIPPVCNHVVGQWVGHVSGDNIGDCEAAVRNKNLDYCRVGYKFGQDICTLAWVGVTKDTSACANISISLLKCKCLQT